MPKYKYKCEKCGGTFLLVQRISDKPEDSCYLKSEDGSRCNGRVVRVPSVTGFSLKGSGWYRDGY